MLFNKKNANIVVRIGSKAVGLLCERQCSFSVVFGVNLTLQGWLFLSACSPHICVGFLMHSQDL